MESETKHESSTAYDAAAKAIASLAPIGSIHQHLCGFQVNAQDPSRQVEVHVFCSHRTQDFSQCLIYDSGDKDARLIGIEYVVSEQVFKSLPEEEKKYWHSHKYEIESGLLYLDTIDIIPNFMNDTIEKRDMSQAQRTYGKTVHTWAVDKHPDLPLGPPQLMMSVCEDGQLRDQVVQERDKKLGISTESKKKYRAGYLGMYEKDAMADQWVKSETGIAFETKQVKLRASE